MLRPFAALSAFALCGLLLLALAAAPAPAGQSPPSPVESQQTEVLVDEETGVVRIVVESREVVRIDADGLHVTGDITYTDTITDTGHHSERPPAEIDEGAE